MYKTKVEIITENKVLEANKVVDIEKDFKPQEIKELEEAGYIELYDENINNFDNDKVKELNTQISTLTATNEELNTQISKDKETIEKLKTKVKELSKLMLSTKPLGTKR